MPDTLTIIVHVKDITGTPVSKATVKVKGPAPDSLVTLDEDPEAEGTYAGSIPVDDPDAARTLIVEKRWAAPAGRVPQAPASPRTVSIRSVSFTPSKIPTAPFHVVVVLPGAAIIVVPAFAIQDGAVVKLKIVPLESGGPYKVDWSSYTDEACETETTADHFYNRTCEECLFDPRPDLGEFSEEEMFTVRWIRAQLVDLSRPTDKIFEVVEVRINQNASLTKQQEAKSLYDRAKELALLFKDNFDKKLDDVSGGIKVVGDAFGRLAGGQGAIHVQLERSRLREAEARPLWITIRNRTDAVVVPRLTEFIDRVFCTRTSRDPAAPRLEAYIRLIPNPPGSPFHGIDSYELLRAAVQAFLLQECGVHFGTVPHAPLDTKRGTIPGDGAVPVHGESGRAEPPLTYGQARAMMVNYLQPNGRLPYIQQVLDFLFPARANQVEVPPYCYGILRGRASVPLMIELIWSYWHEEGMLAQAMNAISRRFQNVRGLGERDPLAALTLDPLRPLSNLLWGYIQSEKDRLSVVRRSYEYDHEYGLRLVGRAIPTMRPADSRSKFLEGLHGLLRACTRFYLQDDDTNVIADGFPVLNALKEVHLVLSQGAHNQYNDLVWTSRAEMLLEQWLLGRQEFQQFLPSRPMVAYPEPWMHRIDSMKQLQGWTDTSVMHFNTLARFGEQILLSVRFDNWSDPTRPVNDASAWARYWRSEIKGYIHAYKTVTGVDLEPETVDARQESERNLLPSVHLQRRQALQR